jgi:hypothetical protein
MSSARPRSTPTTPVLEFPQGKERIRGKANIIAFRPAYPARVSIELHRTIGRQDLWVNEFTIRYDDANPLNVVDIMEFGDGKVVRQRLSTASRGSRRPGGLSGSSRWRTLRSF